MCVEKCKLKARTTIPCSFLHLIITYGDSQLQLWLCMHQKTSRGAPTVDWVSTFTYSQNVSNLDSYRKHLTITYILCCFNLNFHSIQFIARQTGLIWLFSPSSPLLLGHEMCTRWLAKLRLTSLFHNFWSSYEISCTLSK